MAKKSKQNVIRKTWQDMRDSGLFWFINSILHAFGWAIVVSLNEKNEVIDCYPARVRFRGFSNDVNSRGYLNIAKYIKGNSKAILEEAKE